MDQMTQHGPLAAGRVVHQYVVDTLGAPFKVELIDSVTLSVDAETGEEMVDIPDLVGLISAVVRSRVMHTKKLNGEEIKFVRNALGVRAKSVAEFLDMTPEHYSRCETDAKVMSPNSEKALRLFAFLGTFYKDPEDLFLRKMGEAQPKKNAKLDKAAQEFVGMFFSMKIKAARDVHDELSFSFVRRERAGEDDDTLDELVLEYELSDDLAQAA